jgi:hypothetical protein
VSPVEAKKCEKLKTSGRLIKFVCENEEWELLPYSMFYDWIYITALYKNKEVFNELIKYNAFTDIEFNDERSKNCQARSVAIAVSLYKKGLLEKYLTDKELFKTIYNLLKNKSNVYFGSLNYEKPVYLTIEDKLQYKEVSLKQIDINYKHKFLLDFCQNNKVIEFNRRLLA